MPSKRVSSRIMRRILAFHASDLRLFAAGIQGGLFVFRECDAELPLMRLRGAETLPVTADARLEHF